MDRAAVAKAYGLLWNFQSDGSPNSRLITEARKLLREQLARDEMADGITSARAICDRLGARFDVIG